MRAASKELSLGQAFENALRADAWVWWISTTLSRPTMSAPSSIAAFMAQNLISWPFALPWIATRKSTANPVLLK